MVSIFLAFLLFLITIPMKAMELGVRVANKVYVHKKVNKVNNGSTSKTMDTALDRVRQRGEAKKEANRKGSQIALKAMGFALKHLVLFLRGCASVLGVLGCGTMMIATFSIILLVSAGTVSLVMLTDGNFSGLHFSGIGSDQVADKDGVSGSDFSSPNGDMAKAMEGMANWYLDNVYTYHGCYGYKCNNGGTCSHLGKATERAFAKKLPFEDKFGRGVGNYYCDLVDWYITDDCVGFAVACIWYVTGTTESAVDTNCSTVLTQKWQDHVKQYGFEVYDCSTMTLEDLRPGDILVGTEHTEMYVGEGLNFGWGNVQNKYPKTNGFTKDMLSDGTYEPYFWTWKGHDYQRSYKIVIRYVGK